MAATTQVRLLVWSLFCLVEGLQNFATANSLFYPVLAARGQGMDACPRLIYSVPGALLGGPGAIYAEGPVLKFQCVHLSHSRRAKFKHATILGSK